MTSENVIQSEQKLQPGNPFPPILIVEDNEDDCILLEQAFKAAQIINPLMIAHNGEEALAILTGMGAHLRNTPRLPGLMLVDLKMPRMGGFEVLTWIKRHRPLRRMPVVVLTVSDRRADINKAYDLGANSVLRKRHTVPEMAEILKSLHMYWMCWNEIPDLEPES